MRPFEPDPSGARPLLTAVLLVSLATCDRSVAGEGAFVKSPFGPVVTTDGSNFHPFGAIGDPHLLLDGSKIRMWFTGLRVVGTGTELGTAYSESTNGLVWSDPKNPTTAIDLVLPPDPNGFDAYGVETAHVIKRPSDGLYFLYYTANMLPEPNSYTSIGLALSPDGIHWSKVGPVMNETLLWETPIVDSGAIAGGVLEPSLVLEGGLFKMWYAAFGIYQGGYVNIGYAESLDGFTWTKNPLPVLTPGPAGSWDDAYVSHVHVLPDPPYGYHMFYAGGHAASPGSMRIGHAYSRDGVAWTKNPGNPILEGTPGAWDQAMTGGPAALRIDDEILLYYMGSTLVDFQAPLHFGVASADADFFALHGDTSGVSAATGGTQELWLKGGPHQAGKTFLVLGSASGCSPGVSVGGVPVPLNPDSWFFYTARAPNQGILPDSLGQLDATGFQTAHIVIPPGVVPAALVGLTLHHAFVITDAGGVVSSSNAYPLRLEP